MWGRSRWKDETTYEEEANNCKIGKVEEKKAWKETLWREHK